MVYYCTDVDHDCHIIPVPGILVIDFVQFIDILTAGYSPVT